MNFLNRRKRSNPLQLPLRRSKCLLFGAQETRGDIELSGNGDEIFIHPFDESQSTSIFQRTDIPGMERPFFMRGNGFPSSLFNFPIRGIACCPGTSKIRRCSKQNVSSHCGWSELKYTVRIFPVHFHKIQRLPYFFFLYYPLGFAEPLGWFKKFWLLTNSFFNYNPLLLLKIMVCTFFLRQSIFIRLQILTVLSLADLNN